VTDHLTLSRRSVLIGTGALVLSFSSRNLLAQTVEPAPAQPAAPPPPKRPGSLKDSPFLDAWIRVDANGAITVFTGKAELGQGIRTAITQVAAEELEVPFESLKLITADTARTPNEGYTAGSQSMQESGTAVRNAAAQVRELLIAEAAKRANAPADQLRAENGAVLGPDNRRFTYGELVSDTMLHVEALPESKLKTGGFKVMGKPIPRVDIPARVTGGEIYVQDLRPEGMVHARVVRPPSYGATLSKVDTGAAESMPGVVKVVRDGSFLAVVAEREFQAIKAMRALAEAAEWQEKPSLPDERQLPAAVTALAAQTETIHSKGAPVTGAKTTLEATYTKPYIMHGSIGPSCAIARADPGGMTIWSHTQGVYPDRAAIAEMLGMPPEQVHIIHVSGSGCYGHNGADDAAADAALIARAVPGRPVRVQWMREQENGWEPYGPAMVSKAKGSLDGDGRIIDWEYTFWSNTHSTRPGTAGSLIAARHLAKPFTPPEPRKIPLPSGGGSRNSVPLYTIPNARVIENFLPEMPVRVSALRALGAHMNVFAVESFMDELADAAGADPVEFRLKHLDDPRARDVVAKAAERFGWPSGGKAAARGRGYGFGFARYKNLAAYCAVAVEVEVSPATGRSRVVRAAAAIDSGQVVNPDGLTNQTEGAILQSASWTLYERVSFDDTRITSIDWATYPIMRFNAVPERVDVEIIDRPNQPFLGSGEAGQGPTAAAVANAVSRAIGVRMRELPLTHERIRAAVAG
jgi:CO/xanthine dehydrogenase Mo-binding subunit